MKGSVLYAITINPDTRANIQTIFDFKNDRIKPKGLEGSWQTSGSIKATLFAFNMWNGYTDEKLPSTPYDLFCCESAPYFFEAIKLKYPEYCPPEHRKTVKHDAR